MSRGERHTCSCPVAGLFPESVDIDEHWRKLWKALGVIGASGKPLPPEGRLRLIPRSSVCSLGVSAILMLIFVRSPFAGIRPRSFITPARGTCKSILRDSHHRSVTSFRFAHLRADWVMSIDSDHAGLG